MFLFRKSGSLFVLAITIAAGFVNSIDSEPLYRNAFCFPDTSFYPNSNDGFSGSRDTLLESLSSKASNETFWTESLDNISYGLFLCGGDVSTEACQICVKNASIGVKQFCGSFKSAIIWYDICTLRYSSVSFFGELQNDPFWLYNESTTRDSEGLARIDYLVQMTPHTAKMYMTYVSDASRYSMAQCTRDIGSDNCRSCLEHLAVENRVQINGKVGWHYFAPNCNLRYEDHDFLGLPSPPPSAPPSVPPGKPRRVVKVKILVITLSCLGVLAALLGFGLWTRAKRIKRSEAEGPREEVLLRSCTASNHPSFTGFGIISGDEDDSGEINYWSLGAIVAATNGFAEENKLGEGGFGPVYKGKLSNGKEIAVKRMSVKSNQGLNEFKNEVILIIKLQHKNLVRLLGYCFEQDEKLLVYEYMANTSLDSFLFDPVKSKQLDWERRAKIINGTARGLLYLHEDSRLKIIHRDMKTSNVLLDASMDPKISDFGTAKLFGGTQMEATTERVVGTFGYMAPEYALEGLISVKSDVYSFGILMLEIINGKKNKDYYDEEKCQNLLSHAWRLWKEGKGEELLDPNIIETILVPQALRCIHIALLCAQHNPGDRPTMSQVVFMLGSESVNLPQLSSQRPYSAVRFRGSRTDYSSSTWGIIMSKMDRSIT